jgi:F-type H+-transporting ATPase subunit b
VITIDATIVIQFLNFLVLMAVLNYLLFRPLRNILQQRKETIAGSYQAAKDLEGVIDEKMTRYQEQLQEAKLKGNQERAVVRQAAAEEEGKILSAAQAAAATHVQTIREQVSKEAKAASQQLQKETEAIAGEIAAKVLGRAL